MTSIIRGWFADHAPGLGKQIYAIEGNPNSGLVGVGRVIGIGGGYDGLPVLPSSGDTIPSPGSTDTSPVSGMTRTEMFAVFRRAVGFNGTAMLSSLPAMVDGTSFSLSCWLNFGVTGIPAFNPDPTTGGAIFESNSRKLTITGTPYVTTVSGKSSLTISPGRENIAAAGLLYSYGGSDVYGDAWTDAGPFVNLWGGSTTVDLTIPTQPHFTPFASLMNTYSWPSNNSTNAGWVHFMAAVRSVAGNWEAVIYINDSLVASDQITNFSGDYPGSGQPIEFSVADYIAQRAITVSTPFDTLNGGSYEQYNHIGGASRVNYSGYNEVIPGGASGPGLNAAVAELWIAPGQYIDWSLAVNREKFHVKSLALENYSPCDLGATGALPTGTSPKVYLRDGAARFPINRASVGGTLTVTGALIDVDFPPDV